MSNQLKLGLFVFLGIAIITVSIIAVGSFSLQRTYNVYAKFDNISGVTSKAKVKIAGVDIGVLRGASLENSQAKLKLSIDKNVKLYKNGVARIVSIGIVGTKYIEISPGDSRLEELKNGDYIATKQPLSLEAMLENISTEVDKVMNKERYGDMMENLAAVIYSLKDIMKNLASENENIKGLINNLNKFSRDVADISSENKQDVRMIVVSIRDITQKLDDIINHITNCNGTVSTLLRDEQMAKDLKETVKGLKDTTGRISKLQLNFNYNVRYNSRDEKFRNDMGISIMPSHNNFFYVGAANIADHNNKKEDGKTEKNNIKLEVLFGFRAEKLEIYGGIIRGKVGGGVGYSFFEPVWSKFIRLKPYFNVYDFGREKYGPCIDVGIRLGFTKWLYTGIAVEDISNKDSRAVAPYIKLEI